MSNIITFHLMSILICHFVLAAACPAKEIATEFIILHNNDMHSRFEQIAADGEKCTKDMEKNNKCYGGFSRIAHLVRKHREAAKNGGTPVIYLNAGDNSAGTNWYFIFGYKIATAFLNMLRPDAASLGKHEFDSGIPGLLPFLDNVEFPIVAANLDTSGSPQLILPKNLVKSTVLQIDGAKVGVIGYVTPEVQNLTITKEPIFVNEIEAINREAANLKAAGVNIIIALGHSGYEEDQKIAAKCSDVDLVIGGNTNTFLYNGEQPDRESIDGPYPTLVNQTSGKQVPVVQAYAHTKYMGKLNVKFDKDGKLIEFQGNPILLDHHIPREQDVEELLNVYRPEVEKMENANIGYTKVSIDGRLEICHYQECNLGNLVTDAMIFSRVMDDLGGIYWTDAVIAFIQGGGMHNGIKPHVDGAITLSHITDVFWHNNDLYITTISGKTLLAALEHSASMIDAKEPNGFLQMSGVRTIYNYNNPIGRRVVTTEVRCAPCDIPKFEHLEEDKYYNVIVSEFLLNHGDGYNFVEDNGSKLRHLKNNEVETLELYLRKHNIIYPGIEDRITIIPKSKGRH